MSDAQIPDVVETTDGVGTMVQTTIEIDERRFVLAQAQNLPELRDRIEAAIQRGGGFVSVVVVGNREVSVLVNGSQSIIMTVATVLLDVRDTGDIAEPFGGFYDLP
ncbi:hypothetical protein ACFUTX_15210 [Microbacterium sp. NPDC057407]|uniref:hypothetical protein n=1 Tax=Microbacterium sp. NPDC057407 TaxID=3346120 RepID=UPI00366AFB5E